MIVGEAQDEENEEPYVPVTGYNYHRYFKEA